jgi:hypothetical protein
LTYAYRSGDPIHFYSNIWLFNNFIIAYWIRFKNVCIVP